MTAIKLILVMLFATSSTLFSIPKVTLMKKIISLFIFNIIVLSFINGAFANTVKNNYCNPYYKNVDIVFIGYEEKTPNSRGLDWKKIVQEASKTAVKYFENENIKSEITKQTVVEALKNNPDALYLKLVFSYVDKNAVSIPFEENKMASWLEISRILDGSLRTQKVKTFNQEITFRNLTENSKQNHISLRASQMGSLYFVACGVLHSTAHKVCSDMAFNAQFRASSNKIIPIKDKCVDIPSDSMIKIYEELVEKL